MTNVPSGFLFLATRLLARAVGFSCGHPAVFRPAVWRCGLALGVLLAIVLAVADLWTWIPLPAVVAALACVGLFGWWRLLRSSERPLVAFVSRLAPATADAHSATVNHRLAVLEELQSHDLRRFVEGRGLSPLRRTQAEKLLAEGPGKVILYGEARVSSRRWLAKGGILIDSTKPTLIGAGNRDVAPPPRHEPFRDPLELDELVDSPFSASHVETLRAEILDLAAVIES